MRFEQFMNSQQRRLEQTSNTSAASIQLAKLLRVSGINFLLILFPPNPFSCLCACEKNLSLTLFLMTIPLGGRTV